MIFKYLFYAFRFAIFCSFASKRCKTYFLYSIILIENAIVTRNFRLKKQKSWHFFPILIKIRKKRSSTYGPIRGAPIFSLDFSHSPLILTCWKWKFARMLSNYGILHSARRQVSYHLHIRIPAFSPQNINIHVPYNDRKFLRSERGYETENISTSEKWVGRNPLKIFLFRGKHNLRYSFKCYCSR